MTIVFWGAVIVIMSVVLAIIGQAVVHRLVPMRFRESNNAVTNSIYAPLYVMFGVSLAFSLFLVSNEFREAGRTTEIEAHNLEDIYREAGQLPEAEGGRMQELVESYARIVVDEEWALIGRRQESQPSPQAESLFEELEESIEGFEPSTSGEQALHSQLITLADDLGDNRQLRLLESRQGVPSILWTVLVIGGILTVAFTFLFGVEPPWFQRLSIAALTTIIVLVLYTIYRIEYPFTGAVQVKPEAFELVLDKIEGDRDP